MGSSLIFAIDFDGTIVDNEYPFIGALKPNAKDVINSLYECGHYVLIWTCRSDDDYSDGTMHDVKEFLDKNDVLYHGINVNAPIEFVGFSPYPKIWADVYIDDRQLGGLPNDWLEILNMVNKELKNRQMEEVTLISKTETVYPIFEYCTIIDRDGFLGLEKGSKLYFDIVDEVYKYYRDFELKGDTSAYEEENALVLTISVVHQLVSDDIMEYGGKLISDTEMLPEEKELMLKNSK